MALIKIKQINNSPASAGDVITFDGINNVWAAPPAGGSLQTVTSFANLPGSPSTNDIVLYTPFNSVMMYDGTNWVGPKTTVALFGKQASANQSAWLDSIGAAQAHPDGSSSHGYFIPNITDGSVTNSGWKIYHMSVENDTSITADIEIHSNATTSGTPTFGTTGLIRVQLITTNADETELATPVTVNGGDIIQGFFRKATGNARDITTTITYSLFARA